MIGETIGDYKITGHLGSGGMGEVYLADDTSLDRQVALKFLPSALWNTPDARQRLVREAKAASKLDHPNVVTIHSLEEHDGRPFIVMSFVNGSTLTEYCSSGNRTLEDKLGVMLQIVDGVNHAHRAGIIHRDLKPGNILVGVDGRARILDFGIARLHGTTRLTQTGSTLGTLAYSPPELAQGRDATVESDIYALGVIMYEVFTGQLPFEEAHEAALIYAILQAAPKPLVEHNPSIPISLQTCVLQCLEKQPENRYRSCRELADDLRQIKSGALHPAMSGPIESKPSIAVLPFLNMSADPENEYFSDGLSEELMNVLAKNPALKVTGRTSSFAFKGKQEDLRDIGQKLGVETILEGSVRKSGNRVRITTQLVKATDGFHLWTETYDRVLDDIFAVQDDIAKAVSAAMNVTLLGHSARPVRKAGASYSLLLQANYWTQRLTPETAEKAISLYKQVIDHDPENAEAWALLSRTLGQQAGYGFVENPHDVYAEAKAAAQRALELDDSLAVAHEVAGWVYIAYDLDWDKAGVAFSRAVALAPNESRMLVALAHYQAVRGQLEDGLKLARQAIELDPLNPMFHRIVGRIEHFSGLLEEAEASFRRCLELSPSSTSAYSTIATVLISAGRYDDALQAAMQEKSTGYRSFALAAVYHLLGRANDSDAALDTLLGLGKIWAMQIASAYAIRGENEEAFRWLDIAYDERDSGFSQVKVIPSFFNLHNDPRWQSLIERVGL